MSRAFLVLVLGLCAGTAVAEPGTVTARSVNVRTTPTTEESNVVGRLVSGQQVEILDRREGWFHIRAVPLRSVPGTANGTAFGIRAGTLSGWVKQEYVDLSVPRAIQPAEPPERATDLPDVLQSRGVVLRPRVNVRSRPALDPSSIKFTLSQGDRIEVLKAQDYWYNIRTQDGREGWVIAPMVSLGVGLIRPEVYLGGAQALVDAGCRRAGRELEIRSKAAVLEGAQLLEKWVEVYPDSSHTGRAYYYLGLARAALVKLHNIQKDEDAKLYIDAHATLYRAAPGKDLALYNGSDFDAVLKNFPQSSVAPAALLERAVVRRQQVCPSASGCDFTATLEVFRDVFEGRATAKGKETGIEILLEDLRASAGTAATDRPALKKSIDAFLGVVTGLTHLELRKEALRRIAFAYQTLNYPDDAKRAIRLIGPSS